MYMKKKLTILISLYLIFTLAGIDKSRASTQDSIRFSLLTCAPGEEIYTLFGHTAIRYENYTQNIDVVFNYGLFSFNTPHFIWRFSLGHTDYQLGAYNYERFAAEYEDEGRQIWQQPLNLSISEKAELRKQLEINYLPENRIYRYNFFYDNCATRPRIKIEQSVDGQIIYPENPKDYSVSFRDLLHEYTTNHLWARFGFDLCLGREADYPITREQMMFAPIYLMDFFKQAQVRSHDHQNKPLVTETQTLIENPTPPTQSADWFSPLRSALLLFMVVCGITIYEIKKKKAFWGIDLFLFVAAGITGSILCFLTCFSQHPAVGENYLLFVFHPLHLLWTPYLVYCSIKKRKCRYHQTNLVVLTLFIMLFPIIPQRFDLAIVPLALCLLIRSANHLIRTYKKEQ